MILVVPVSLEVAKQVVRDWHSHHDPMVGHMWSTGAVIYPGELVGVVVVSRPVAPALQNQGKNAFGGYETLEVVKEPGKTGAPRTSRLGCSAQRARQQRDVASVCLFRIPASTKTECATELQAGSRAKRSHRGAATRPATGLIAGCPGSTNRARRLSTAFAGSGVRRRMSRRSLRWCSRLGSGRAPNNGRGGRHD
jgi:hypothetical protein